MGALMRFMRGRRHRARCAIAVLLSACLGTTAVRVSAQHETARDIEDGGRIYQNACAYCHGPDGDLITGIDFGRGVYRRALSDEEIARIIVSGIPNTPMPPTPGVSVEQAERIVTYLRAMPAERSGSRADGDSARGRAIFAGEGGCLDCHRVGPEGSRVGPDLSRIGMLRRSVELERSLLDPQAEVQPQNRFYRVTLTNGEEITGRLLNHDTFTVQMIDGDEHLRSFHKDRLASHGFMESPMPSYGDRLSEQQIADLIAYLASLRDQELP